MVKTNLLMVAALAMTATTQAAHADFFFGGHVELEAGACCGNPTFSNDTSLRGEVILGYSRDNVIVGVGASLMRSDLSDNDDPFFGLVHVGNVTVTYGDIYGAGNMVGEDYFDMDDSTTLNTGTLRIDYAGAHFHLAVSAEIDDPGDAEFELGFATSIAGNFVRIAYEADGKDLTFMTGRDMGDWGYHFVAMNDLDADGWSDQLGLTLLYDVTPEFTVAGNIALSPGEGLHSYGFMAWYEMNDMTFRAQITKNLAFGSDNTDIEVGLVIPFGDKLPAAYERQANKEFHSGYGFFENQHADGLF